jgi:hypothetical protein
LRAKRSNPDCLVKRHDIKVKIRAAKAGLPRPTKAKSVGLAMTAELAAMTVLEKLP